MKQPLERLFESLAYGDDDPLEVETAIRFYREETDDDEEQE